MPNLDTFVSVYDWIKGPVGLACLPLAVIGLVCVRTRSSHIMWFRLWALFIAKRAAGESPVERFHDEQMAMLKFRWLTNIPVRTPAQVPPMIKWLKVNDQEPSAVAACGGYFDVTKPGLAPAGQQLKGGWIFLPFILAISLFLAAMPFSYGVTQDRLLLQFKVTKHWFLLDRTFAKPFDSNRGFELAQCGTDAAPLSRTSGFEISEVKILCDAKKKHEVDTFIQNNLEEQRIAFGACAFVCLVFVLSLTRVFQRMKAVLELKRVLREHASTIDA